MRMQERSFFNRTGQQPVTSVRWKGHFLWVAMLYMVLCLAFVPGKAHAAGVPQLSKSKITMSTGRSYKLKVKNYKEKVVWRSSNTYVAKVSKKGVVKAKHIGYSTITAQCGETTLKCLVTVEGTKSEKPYIFCYEVDHDGKRIETGEKYNFAVMNGSNRTWTWSVDDSNHALLYRDGNGVTTNTLSGGVCQIVETFMGKPGTAVITAKSGSITLSYRMVINQSKDDATFMQLRSQVLAQVLKPGMTAQEQCLAVAKWLSRYATYKITNGPDNSLLKNHVGQCYHYARTFEFMMEGTTVPCDYVSTKDHAWNQVMIEGSWYNIDVTGFDTDNNSAPYDYVYFLVSDAAFWKKEPRLQPYHVCVNTRYDFGKHYASSPWELGTWRSAK